MTVEVYANRPEHRGVSLLLHAKDDLFRVLWTKLDPAVRGRLLATTGNDLGAITLGRLVRECGQR